MEPAPGDHPAGSAPVAVTVWPEPIMAIARVLASRRGGEPVEWREDALACANAYVLQGGTVMTLSERNLAMIRGERVRDVAG